MTLDFLVSVQKHALILFFIIHKMWTATLFKLTLTISQNQSQWWNWQEHSSFPVIKTVHYSKPVSKVIKANIIPLDYYCWPLKYHLRGKCLSMNMPLDFFSKQKWKKIAYICSKHLKVLLLLSLQETNYLAVAFLSNMSSCSCKYGTQPQCSDVLLS